MKKKTKHKVSKQHDANFFAMAEQLINRSHKQGQTICSLKTMINRRTALNRLASFWGRQVMTMNDFTPQLMCRFEQHLIYNKEPQERVGANTSAAYMRSLRTLYHLAVKETGGSNKHPFKGVRTGNVRTQKMLTLTEEEMARVATADVKNSRGREQLAHTLFMLSFYLCGMPLADLMQLKRGQLDLERGLLRYNRKKTGLSGNPPICPEAMALLTRFLRPEMKGDDYVFPILTKGADEATNHRRYGSALSACNRALHRIGGRLGLPLTLTSYVARHTWANVIYHQYGANKGEVSLGLCHASEKTTEIYLTRADHAGLRNAQSRLLKGFRSLCRRSQKQSF